VGSATATQQQVISAVGTIAGHGRTPFSTAVVADSAEGRIPAGHVTREFTRVISPLRGVLDAPAGDDRREGDALIGVAAGTNVTFYAVRADDVVMPGAVDEVFAVYVNLYNDGRYLEKRTFYVLVPAPR
jgi:hypothetical protein